MSAFIRRLVGGAGAVAATITLVGCSTVEGTPFRVGAAPVADSPVGDGTESGPADPRRSPELVLTAADFPAGFEVVEIPEGQLAEMAETIVKATREAKVDPASCVQPSLIPEAADLSAIGLITATKGSTINLGEAIAVVPATIEDQRKMASGECERVTMTMDIGFGPYDAIVEQKLLPAPSTKVPADQTLVVEQQTEAKVQSTRVVMLSRLGYAMVNGYTVTVTYTSATGTPIDDAVFDEFFTKAVNKVADET